MSKNRKFVGRYAKVLAPKYRKAKADLTRKILKTLRSNVFSKDKIMVSIFVFKKNNRGDCANLIECIFDGIKDAILVDDCYYCVLCEYEIDKKNQRVEIKIEQDNPKA